MSKKILITGSSGMLGKELLNVFSEDKKYQVFALSRKKNKNSRGVIYVSFDLNDFKKIPELLNKIEPDIIIHAAALVNVDFCEANHKVADALHVKATKALATYQNLKTKFVYISTDSVFDGRRGNYAEKSKTGPLNYYAKSKLRGEQESLSINPRSLIVRTNIFGFHLPAGKSLIENTLETLNKNESITGFQDVIFNPVYTKHLALIIKKLLEKKESSCGILNISGDKILSKYDFLIILAKIFKKNVALIKPGFIKDVKLKAARPKKTNLSNLKLKKIINSVPSLEKGLKDLKKDYLKINL